MLSRWSRSDDIRLSAQAICALANLDRDGNEGAKYPQRIYLLHPSHRVHVTTKMDVVFLHGLLGGVFVTWRQRDVDGSTLGTIGSLLYKIIQIFGIDLFLYYCSHIFFTYVYLLLSLCYLFPFLFIIFSIYCFSVFYQVLYIV